ncbi:MAG TPA: hypothetical protein PKH10_04335 [bacterium]|nr:hypothetical protein [bacterium]
MEHFQFLAFPEQLPSVVKKQGHIPVVPLWFPGEDLDRIVPWLRRREHPFALAFDRDRASVVPLARALTVADRLFLFSPDDAERARAARFAGALFLFSSGAMLSWPQWYRDHKVRPVVSGRPNWEAARGLDPLYLATTKRCIAEFGTCRARDGRIQQFTACDLRCRDKVRERQSVTAPFSLRPEYTHPPDAKALVAYDESVAPPVPRPAPLAEPVLNDAWNYPWPLGRRILREAHKTGDTRFHVILHAEERRLYEDGLVAFWCYDRTMYDGEWLEPSRATVTSGRLLLTFPRPVRKALFVQRYDEATKDLLKRARHQIYTMPSGRLFFTTPEKPKGAEDLRPLRTPARRGSTRLTVVLDDPDRAAFFRIRDIDRVALLHDGRPVGKFFNHHLYIPFPLKEEEARQIAAHPRLRGVIVRDRLMQKMFESLFEGRREVLLHPATPRAESEGAAPSYLAGAEQVFSSIYTAEHRKDYHWRSLGLRTANRRGHTLFLRDTKVLQEGSLAELWVDIIGADDATVRDLKMRAERYLKEKRVTVA